MNIKQKTDPVQRLIYKQIHYYILLSGLPLLLLILWQVLGDMGYINVSVLSSPQRIGASFVSYAKSGMLFVHLWNSIKRVMLGFAIGASCGLVLGILAGFFQKFRIATSAVLGVIRPIPMVGFAPLFVLWFGIGELSKILIVAIGSLWPVLLNTENGLQGVDKKHLEVAKTLKKDKFTILRKIILPSAAPSLLTGLRMGLSNGWRGIVAAELIGSTRGIGYLISYSRELSQPAVMFMGLLIIGIVGVIIDAVLQYIQKKLLHWA